MLELANLGELQPAGLSPVPLVSDFQWLEQELFLATELQSELLPTRHPPEARI